MQKKGKYTQPLYLKFITLASKLGIPCYDWEEDCKLGESIGSGAIMTVHEGFCKINGSERKVAFKKTGFISSKIREDKLGTALNAFQQEIRLMTCLKGHPHIVQLLGISFCEMDPVLILELADEDLENYLDKMSDCIDWTIKFKLICEITDGLEAIHNADIIHGDIKSSNILIFLDDNIPVAKIADFGYSSTLRSIEAGRTPGYTYKYRAPECFDSSLHEWSGRRPRDLYSYGITVSQIIADGKEPFYTMEQEEVDTAKKSGSDLDIILKMLPVDTPSELREIIQKTVQPIPAERASISDIKYILTHSPLWDTCSESVKTEFESFASQPLVNEKYIWISLYFQNKISLSLAKRIFLEYKTAAETSNDPFLHICLAWCYWVGIGVEVDFSQAIDCYRKVFSNQLTDETIQCVVGNTGVRSEDNYNSDGITEEISQRVNDTNYAIDRHIQTLASEQLRILQITAGFRYQRGIGVEENHAKAFEWFTKASEFGYSRALTWLGVCYECGYGVEMNLENAVKLYNEAAAGGDGYAEAFLGGIYFTGGPGVKMDWTRAQEHLKKAMAKGIHGAKEDLRLMFWFRHFQWIYSFVPEVMRRPHFSVLKGLAFVSFLVIIFSFFI